jgi:hypothetical protein
MSFGWMLRIFQGGDRSRRDCRRLFLAPERGL